MEIFLLLAIVAIGASGLYVAVWLSGRARLATKALSSEAVKQISVRLDTTLTEKLKELRIGLARESVEREQLSARVQFEQIVGLISDGLREGAQATAGAMSTRLPSACQPGPQWPLPYGSASEATVAAMTITVGQSAPGK